MRLIRFFASPCLLFLLGCILHGTKTSKPAPGMVVGHWHVIDFTSGGSLTGTCRIDYIWLCKWAKTDGD